jgi:hypothetical protein
VGSGVCLCPNFESGRLQRPPATEQSAALLCTPPVCLVRWRVALAVALVILLHRCRLPVFVPGQPLVATRRQCLASREGRTTEVLSVSVQPCCHPTVSVDPTSSTPSMLYATRSWPTS